MPKVKTSMILIKRKCKKNGEVEKSDLAVVLFNNKSIALQ